MLIFYLYPPSKASKLVYLIIGFAVLFIISHFLFDNLKLKLGLLFFMVILLFLMSFFEKPDTHIGTVKFDGQNVYISTENRMFDFNFNEQVKVKINYGGYRDKRMIGDFIPLYNTHAGIDNILEIEFGSKTFKYRFLVENETEELQLLEHVRFLQDLNYLIVFNQ